MKCKLILYFVYGFILEGARWDVAFIAGTQTEIQFVTNLTTSIQYKWTGAEWIKSYQGVYPGGDWSLVL